MTRDERVRRGHFRGSITPIVIGPTRQVGLHGRNGFAFETSTIDRNVVEFTVDGQNVHGSLGRSVESGAVGLRVGESETTDGDDSREQIWLFARHSVRHESSVFPADDVHFIFGDVILSLDCVDDL